MRKREYRVVSAELRAAPDSKTIRGYAAVFGQESGDLGGFRETIRSGAFARALSAKQDVRCLFNHNPSMLLGRTSSGTLKLSEDDRGLMFECDLPDTQLGRDVHALIQRGDISQCSFAFCAVNQEWDDSKNPALRTLTDVDLDDVSPVTFPAYPQTSVSARSLWPDGEPEDVIEHRDKPTAKVDGVDLPASSFLIVPDPAKPSTWKLPVIFPGDEEKTKAHIRNALARFDQIEGVSEEEKNAAHSKLLKLAKEHGIHTSEENPNENSKSVERIIRLYFPDADQSSIRSAVQLIELAYKKRFDVGLPASLVSDGPQHARPQAKRGCIENKLEI